MIKFFRHIRKSLIEQNKMGKYFKYAIGEIILVVIGILIALQINNWNHLEAKRTYHDSLDSYFYVPTANYSFGISYATFENLKSQGLDIISNKDLRLTLVKLYEEDYWLLKDQETKVANAFTNAKCRILKYTL